MAGYLLIWLCFALGGAALAQRRTGKTLIGFLAGLVFGPLGLLLILLDKPDPKVRDREAERNGQRRCPYCAEFIRPEARVCRYCARDVPLTP